MSSADCDSIFCGKFMSNVNVSVNDRSAPCRARCHCFERWSTNWWPLSKNLLWLYEHLIRLSEDQRILCGLWTRCVWFLIVLASDNCSLLVQPTKWAKSIFLGQSGLPSGLEGARLIHLLIVLLSIVWSRSKLTADLLALNRQGSVFRKREGKMLEYRIDVFGCEVFARRKVNLKIFSMRKWCADWQLVCVESVDLTQAVAIWNYCD